MVTFPLCWTIHIGLLERRKDKFELGAKGGAAVAKVAFSALPGIGSIIGNILGFGIKAAVSAVRDKKHKNNNEIVLNNILDDSTINEISELIARKVTQRYLDYLSTTLTDTVPLKVAKKYADFIVQCFKDDMSESFQTTDQKLPHILTKLDQHISAKGYCLDGRHKPVATSKAANPMIKN